jgi:NAD(P)-dependent dehydrogenase (short-subunit alcohol dehydrogenase family)
VPSAPVALVTGAGSGIGAAAARALSDAGFALLLGDVNEEAVTRVAGDLGDDALAVHVDVRDDASLQEFVRRGVERFGGFDAVLANAGLAVPEAPLAETPVDAIDWMIAVNLRGAMLTVRAALPELRDGGSIVLTSSISGLQAHPFAAAYAATKTALIGFGRSLALEVAPRRIRVNMVCPGGVDTPLVRNVYGDEAPKMIAEYEQINPLGRIARPEDIAAAMRFLVSPEAGHVNGVALRVDGGDCLMGAV